MLKGNEYKGEETLYSFFSVSNMDEASRKLFAKVYAANKAKKVENKNTKEYKHHKKVTL